MIYCGGHSFAYDYRLTESEVNMFLGSDGECVCCRGKIYQEPDGFFGSGKYEKTCDCTWDSLYMFKPDLVRAHMKIDFYGHLILSEIRAFECLDWVSEEAIISLSERLDMTFKDIYENRRSLIDILMWSIGWRATGTQRKIGDEPRRVHEKREDKKNDRDDTQSNAQQPKG